MVDREKVIKGLYAHGYKDCKSCPYWGSGLHGSSECKELAREALSLLREQEPVKPIRLENWWKCPSCSGNIVANMKYCPRCGRAVKWDA